MTTYAHTGADAGATVDSELVVDEENRFFFDHPLDHVPAMLLLDAALHAAGRLPGASASVTALHMRFDRFCEKDLPSRLRVSTTPRPGGARLLDARVVQAGAEVARAALRVEPAPSGPLFPAHVTGPRTEPADPRLVHKRSAARVLVGRLDHGGGRTLTTPVLAPVEPGAADVHPLTLLVEAARQASTMVNHSVWDTPPDWQFIVSTLELSLPVRTPWPHRPVLRCHPRRLHHSDDSVMCELLLGDAPQGRISFTGRTVPPAAYRRLRESARRSRRTEAAR